jgi:hypothetical protein
MALGSTQPLTEMSTMNIPGSEGRPAHKADNLTAICEPIVYKNVGASTSGPLQGYLLPFIFQPHYGPGAESAYNRNEYQVSSWGQRVADA